MIALALQDAGYFGVNVDWHVVQASNDRYIVTDALFEMQLKAVERKAKPFKILISPILKTIDVYKY